MNNLDFSQPTTTVPVKLTNRELEILTHIIEGQSSKAVANQLFISKRTVDFHLTNIYEKMQVTNRMQAYQCAVRLGLVSAD